MTAGATAHGRRSCPSQYDSWRCCAWLQIKPFVLRRTKDQVLKDLPPKILQDIFVDPSPLQVSPPGS